MGFSVRTSLTIFHLQAGAPRTTGANGVSPGPSPRPKNWQCDVPPQAPSSPCSVAEDSRETVRGRPDWHLGHSQTCLQDTPHFRGSAKAALSSPWSRPRRDPEEERSPEDRGKGCVLRAHCVRCTEPHTSLGDGVPGREESPSELSLPRGSAREAEAERESRAMKAMSLSQPASARASASFPRQERGPTGMTLEESASGDPQSLPVLSQPRLQQPPREGLCVPCCSLPLSSVKTEAPPRS